MKYLNEIWDHLEAVHLDGGHDYSELKRLFRITDEQIKFDVSVDRGELINIKRFETLLAKGMKNSIDLVIAEHKTNALNSNQYQEIITKILIESYHTAKKTFHENTIATREKNWSQVFGVLIGAIGLSIFFYNLGAC